MTTGEMRTERARRLAWEGSLNVRDLGGYPTTDGCETRWGVYVRADNLAPLTEIGRAALLEYGIRTIVDLRTPREIETHPNPFAQAGEHGVAYVNISLVNPSAPRPNFPGLTEDYSDMLDIYSSAIAQIMQAFADAAPGGVLFHCMGGKDRTGIIAALLLSLAHVPRDVIGADYALTAECLRSLDEEYLEHGPGERAEREKHLARYEPTAKVMLAVLDHLDERYGGVEPYLLQAGVTQQSIQQLHDRLVPPAS